MMAWLLSYVLVCVINICHNSNVTNSFNTKEIKILESIDPDLFNALSENYNLTYSLAMNLLADQHLVVNSSKDAPIYNHVNHIITDCSQILQKLRAVGNYLREHKFYERDWRLYSRDLQKPDQVYYQSMIFRIVNDPNARFMYSFPEPPLLHEHPDVVDKCSSSSLNCLNYVYTIVA